MHINIAIDKEQLRAFCTQWHITEISLFGSVLREDFRPDSDVDVLVTFDQDAVITLFDMVRMARALGDIFGRNVDLVERSSIEKSHNPVRRKEILTTAQEVYRAAA